MLRTIAVTAALLAGAGPAMPVQAGPQSRLTLTYLASAGYTSAVKLTCYPPGGPHPEAVQACAELRSAGADPAKIKPAQVMCMMLYAPVTAKITGVWRGGPIKWSHRYGNTCEMTRATGVLFKF